MGKFKNWALVNYQKGKAFRAITNNGKKFVAIGESGLCWTSQDGKKWIRGKPNRTNTFDIIYAASKFVLVGYKGFIATSADGVTWKERSTPPSEPLKGIVYGDGKFVATGNKGTILTSTDAITWTRGTSDTTGDLLAVVYANGLFVAVGTGRVILTSNNGINWKRSFGAEENLNSVTYGAGLYVAGGRGEHIYTSPDGSKWTKRYQGDAKYYIQDIVYTGSVFVAVGSYGNVRVSSDGINWTPRVSKAPTTIMGATYMDGKVVTVGLYRQINMSLSDPNPAPELILAEPNGKDEYKAGESQRIRWGSFGSVGKVKLEYSTDNGSSWTEITSSTANTGSYKWTVPDKTSTGCLVRVSEAAGGGPSDTSNAAFTIIGEVVKPLTLIAPNGGEQLDIGKEYSIRWTSKNVPENIRIRFSSDGGDTWTKIFQNTPNTGSCKWTVPDVHSADCLIRINAVNTEGVPNDVSNNTFAIGVEPEKPLTLTSPDGGEQLDIGKEYTIRWTSKDVPDNIRIRFSSDGGDTWTKIAHNTPNTGSYKWTVPDVHSADCLIRINAINTEGVPNDMSNNTFAIGVEPEKPITLTSPKGGEVWDISSIHDITWTSKDVGEFVRLEISTDGGSSWTELDARTRNDGIWEDWEVPDTSSSKCLIRVSDYSDSSVNDTREIGLTIPEPASITLNSPDGGENWLEDSTQTITWTTSGSVDNVKIQYSADNGSSWDTIIESTPNSGSFSWTLPGISSNKCKMKVSDASDADISDTSEHVFSITGLPEIALSKARFNFASVIGGAVTGAQTLSISNNGGYILNWTAETDASWLKLNPGSGSGDGFVTISVDPSGLGEEKHSATIRVSDANAGNSPQTAAVHLTVKDASQVQPPFGEFATPKDGTTGVTGSIALTGWVLDDIEVAGVKIYREVNRELSYIGDAVFVEGTRPDVEKAYPDYPNNSSAGWGYMMLTNFLPDGELVLKAIAKSSTGEEVVLGTKTVYLDNQNAVKPFGAIDKPAQGGEASGTDYRCQGWVLTPPPNKIPEDGSTINVFIDGKFVGKANYNIPIPAIAGKFPDCANSSGPMAYFDFDTTAYKNGIHTIEWSVIDNAGNTAGIGSRYFTIRNP